jgi:hypothetical protein
MAEPFRVIGFDDLRDAMEMLITLDISDDELRERDVALSEYETLLDGLGPSTYTVLELATREQYLLHRLDWRPEVLNVDASLDENPRPLVARFLAALDVPRDRIRWAASDEFWDETRRSYDRDKWLEQRRRLR